MRRKCLQWMVVLVMSVLVVGIFVTNAPAAEKVYKWKMQSFMPAASYLNKLLQQFCDDVKVATGGRLQITLFPAGALFPDIDGFKNVSAGVSEMAVNYMLFYQGIVPEALALYPPYGLQRFEDIYSLWYHGGWREIMTPHYTKHNIHKAAALGMGAEPIWSKIPIRSMNDFKGLKIRMTGAAAEFFNKKLGASTTLLAGPEIYTALKLGTVDATEFSGGSLDYDLGIHEVTKYMIMPYYVGQGLIDFLVNLKAYNRLPDDLRKTFDMACRWAEIHISLSIEADNRQAIEKMKQKGMQVIWLPDEDVAKMRELARDFWNERLATISPDAKKLIDLYIAKCKEVGILK